MFDFSAIIFCKYNNTYFLSFDVYIYIFLLKSIKQTIAAVELHCFSEDREHYTFFFFKKIINRGHIKLIKSDSKDV